MRKADRFELSYIYISWILIALGFINITVNEFFMPDHRDNLNFMCGVSFFIVISVLNAYKLMLVKQDKFQKQCYYIFFRLLELTAMSIAVILIGVSQWVYTTVFIPILVTSFFKGRKWSFYLIGYCLFAQLVILGIRQLVFGNIESGVLGINFYERAILFTMYYATLIMFAFICSRIYEEHNSTIKSNHELIKELEVKYSQLTKAQEETKDHYERLKETNCKLEDTNKRLTGSIAEFYTLQQISKAIASIFDIKELLKYVNDIIIGVMGVNYSSIIVFDDKRNKLKLSTTNIKNRQELIMVTDNINCKALLDCLDSGKPIIESFVDQIEYPFTQGREVNSLICVPLMTKSKKFGLVLAEQKYYNAFDEENLRLIDIISQQVGIAMENAELYQQMHYLATIDGLTGVYNRVYFHEVLAKEFSHAMTEDYALSLAIFDIDHFKRFNDTYGHLFGDKVLKNIAELVRNALRSTDIFARFGGEEFIILFPHTNLPEAYDKVELLRQKISKTYVTDNLVSASVTVSFGLASFPGTALNEGELLRQADDALYEAKEAGRNCVRSIEPIN